jgi:hypothetical protein
MREGHCPPHMPFEAVSEKAQTRFNQQADSLLI